jgi:hypothetical protein
MFPTAEAVESAAPFASKGAGVTLFLPEMLCFCGNQ